MTPHHSPCTDLLESPGHPANNYPADLARTWTLASGDVLLLRPVRHDDDEREEAFVRGLSRESGYQRTLSAIKITPEWIERMTHIDYRCHMAFAVTTLKDGVEQFLGVGRYVVQPATQRAEIALVITDSWQGRGLGHGLLETLIEHAKEAGVRELEGIVIATNKAMLRLARALGFGISAEPGDATVVRIRRNLQPSATAVH